MTTEAVWSSSSDTHSTVTPHQIRRWLELEHWSLTRSLDNFAEIWAQTSPGFNERRREVFVPLSTDFLDFDRRMASLLSDLSRIYEVPLGQLTDDIAGTTSDVLLIRLNQSSMDSTIPLKQATALLASVQKMMRSAATTAANPLHPHVGRRPRIVNEFMEDDLRFGHTKRGSFVVTVTARLGDGPEPSSPELETPPISTLTDPPSHQADGTLVARPTSTNESAEPFQPFPRRVMDTLARSLAATRELARSDAALGIEQAEGAGVTSELVQSVVEITQFSGVKEVDLSFEWASAARKTDPPSSESHVRFTADDTEILQQMRKQLTRRATADPQTLTGRITDLRRTEIGNGQEERYVIVEAVVDGRSRRVRVALSTEDYEWALLAHQRRLLFTLKGKPVKRGGRWVMDSPTIDPSFLQHIRRDEHD